MAVFACFSLGLDPSLPPHPTLISSLLNPSPGTLKGSPWLDRYQPQEGLGEGTHVMGGVSKPPPPTPTSCPQPLPPGKAGHTGAAGSRGRSRRGPRTLDSTQGLPGGRRRWRAEPGTPPGLGWGGRWPRGTWAEAAASPLPRATAATASRGQQESRAQAVPWPHPAPSSGDRNTCFPGLPTRPCEPRAHKPSLTQLQRTFQISLGAARKLREGPLQATVCHGRGRAGRRA